MVGQLVPADVVPDDPVSTRSTRWRRVAADAIAIAVLLGLFPVVHDVRTMLTYPYWLDEAWVALSVRFPISDLLVTSSSTPLGWTFLLRLVPDTDYLRLVPLAFHGVTIVAAFALGRLLFWPTHGQGILAGLACGATVLLLPAQQIRHDLKQYTADAAVTLILLALSAWTEQAWSRRRLGVLVAAVAVGILVSHVTAIAFTCVFAGLVIVNAGRRQWRRLIEALVAGMVAESVILAVYVGFSARGKSTSLEQYWTPNFPSLPELPEYLGQQASSLIRFVGAPAVVVLAFVACGVLALMRLGRASTALAVVLLPIAAIVLGLADVYPLLELRTSHFLLVTTAAVAGLGVAGAATAASTLMRRTLSHPTPMVVAAVLCALLLGVFTIGNSRWYRFDGNDPGFYHTPMATEDIRSATAYVAAHRSPNDIIVVNDTARYGFGFYWRQDPIELVAPYRNTVGWHVGVRAESGIVFVTGRNSAAIRRGLDKAFGLAALRGPGSRVWLIRSHLINNEPNEWRSVLSEYRVELVTNGLEPVALITKR